MALLTPISNKDLWNAIRAKNPSFKSVTSEATDKMFTENGYEELKNRNESIISDFFGLSVRTYLQLVNISHAQDLLEGVFESYFMPLGSVIQRLSVNPIKPVNPGYINLEDGGSVDPYVIRKPDTKERFWHNPISFQNYITIFDVDLKQIFISEFGMSEYVGGILSQLQESLKTWKYENKLNALNVAINSEAFPLKKTQVFGVKMDDIENATDDELKEFILDVKKTATAMSVPTRTAAFNANGFSTVQDKSRLKLLMRAGVKDQIDVKSMVGAFNPQFLSLGFDIVEVENFGGLEAYKDAEYTTKLYPVYETKTGVMLGWSEEENKTGTDSVTVEDGEQYYKDTNSDIIAVLCDKGWIFETITNEVRSTAAYNPRGLYTTTYISMPNYYTSIDSNYNAVVFRKTAE